MKKTATILVLASILVMILAVGGTVSAQQATRTAPLICDQLTGSPTAERVSYYMGQGAAFYLSNQLQQSNDSFSCIVEQLDTRNAQAFASRGVINTAQHEYEKALDDYAAAISLDHNMVGAYNNRGIVYAALQQFDDAVLDFNRALGVDPSYQLALVNRGVIYAVQGKYEDSIADLQHAIDLSGIDDVVADLTRPDQRGDDPMPQYNFEDAHVYSILGIVYSQFALDNYQKYMLLTSSNGDRRIQSAAGALESRFNFDLRLDDGTWLLATEFIPGG